MTARPWLPTWFSSLAGAAMLLATVQGRADGVVIHQSALSPATSAKIQSGIASAKRSHPEVFRTIRMIRGHRPETYRRFRSQRPDVVPELLSLGPGAKWALIDAIAFGGLERGSATDEEWSAIRGGLLWAIAELKAPEASPVLREILSSPSSDWSAMRGAGVALGKLGGPEERSALFAALRRGRVQRDAALWGLRHVRHPEAVRAVAPWLSDGAPNTVKLAARALGYIGSSWAWRTGKAGDPKQEMPIRTACADVLLKAFVHHNGDVREHIARAFAMVDHPRAATMVDARLSNSTAASERAALLGLKQRLSRAR